jgi:hypothetical protein
MKASPPARPGRRQMPQFNLTSSSSTTGRVPEVDQRHQHRKVAAQHRRLREQSTMTNPHLKYQSQSVAKLYFIAALGLFTGQIVFG